MSTSLLYHAFGIRGYDYVRTDYRGGQVIFTIAQDPADCRCSACGSREVISRGHADRRFRSLPIGSRPTAVVLPIPRVECRACGAVRQVLVPFADPRREVPPPSVVERRHLGESFRLAVDDPIADPGLRASQEFWTAQAYTGHLDSSSACRLHSSGESAVIATERPGRLDRPDRSASHRQNPDDSGRTP